MKTLKITDVTETDAGDYRCTATNTLGTVHHIIKVAVKGMSVISGTFLVVYTILFLSY